MQDLKSNYKISFHNFDLQYILVHVRCICDEAFFTFPCLVCLQKRTCRSYTILIYARICRPCSYTVLYLRENTQQATLLCRYRQVNTLLIHFYINRKDGVLQEDFSIRVVYDTDKGVDTLKIIKEPGPLASKYIFTNLKKYVYIITTM